MSNRRFGRVGPSASGGGTDNARSIVEVDMLVVDDGALLVLHDVVAVQAVAVLVKIILAFRAGIFFYSENGVPDFCRIGRAGLVDRRGQNGDGVIGPRALGIRRGLVGLALGFAEGLRSLVGIV